MTSSIERVGDAVLVNTTTPSNQVDPTIAALAGGGFVVGWTDSGATGIRAQAFHATGARLGIELLVAATADQQEQPAITALPNGGFVVGWTERSTAGDDTSGFGVKAQQFQIVESNAAPVAPALADLAVFEDRALSFQVAAFSDVDGDTVAYEATLASGSALPAWLVFDAVTRTFSGMPPVRLDGFIDLTVTARDGLASATGTFQLTLAEAGLPDHETTGTPRPETMRGGDRVHDTIRALGGNDVVLGQGGRDHLHGGTGRDRLDGGGGDDLLFGAGGADRLIGGHGDDRLIGSGGADRLFGGQGADRLRGGDGHDVLTGAMARTCSCSAPTPAPPRA